MAVGFVASASSGSQASVASFNIGTLGTGARAGIVFVAIHNSATDIITGVTWNGVSMTLLYKATDTDTEPGVVKAYFLDNVSNGTITAEYTYIDLAFGDATNKHVIMRQHHGGVTNETVADAAANNLNMFNCFCPVPAGSTMYVRGRCINAPDTGYNAVAVGIG